MKNRTRALAIAVTSIAGAAAIAAVSGARTRVAAWSTGTAYVAFVLLAVSLSLGPLNVLRERHNPVHSVLRRDFGMAAGIAAITHTLLGLQVHMGGSVGRYFTLPDHVSPSRVAFVTTNYAGLAASLVLLILVAISNNISIRAVGLERWKSVQRIVYFAAVATAVHGLLYQLIEKRFLGAVAFLAVASLAVLMLQLRGRKAKTAA